MSGQTDQTKMKRAIGYVRVSTRVQGQNGISLDAQSALLRDYAHQQSMDLLGICEDAQSAYNERSSMRPGFREALSRATSEGLPILIVSVDRLSRSMKDLSLPDLSAAEIISVKEGKVGPRKLKKLVKAAEAASADAARLSREMVKSSKTTGREPGNKTNLKEAQRRGAVNNMLRSQRKVQELADFIAQNPSISLLSWLGRVEALNSAGILNLVSEVHDEKQLWTMQSLRRPFKAALAEIEMREDMDREDAAAAVSGLDEGIDNLLPCHTVDRAEETSTSATGAQVAVPAAGDESQAPTRSSGNSEGSAPSQAEGAATAVPSLPALPQFSGDSRPDPDNYPFPLRRRPLTENELILLRRIMTARGMSQSMVMDELGKPRLDPSLWQSRNNGTTVSPDMLGRLVKWLGQNRAVWRT